MIFVRYVHSFVHPQKMTSSNNISGISHHKIAPKVANERYCNIPSITVPAFVMRDLDPYADQLVPVFKSN